MEKNKFVEEEINKTEETYALVKSSEESLKEDDGVDIKNKSKTEHDILKEMEKM